MPSTTLHYHHPANKCLSKVNLVCISLVGTEYLVGRQSRHGDAWDGWYLLSVSLLY